MLRLSDGRGGRGIRGTVFVLLCKYPPGEPMHYQTCLRGRGTQPRFCTARPPCLLFFTPSPHWREPGPPTSGTLEPGCTRGLCREPSEVCSQTRGAGTPAAAGGGHRGAALPQGSAQRGALDLLVQLPAGGRLSVSAAFALAGFPEAFGSPTWMDPAFHSHLCPSLQCQVGCGPLICHSTP